MKAATRFIFVKIPKFILLGIAYFLLLIINIFFIVYLLCPVYDFPESQKFQGDNWHNPYQSLPENSWKQANFHAHTNAWGLLTDGRKNKPEDVTQAYEQLHYDVIGISDYQKITRFRQQEMDFIPIYEHGYNIPKAHQLSIGAKKVYPWDFMFFQQAHQKQQIINALQKRSELVAVAHPQKWGGYSNDEMAKLWNYDLLEVLNHYGNSENCWDAALSAGHLVYLIADDDSHDISKMKETGSRYTQLCTEDVRPQAVFEALRQGHSYGVDVAYIEGESIEEKAARIAAYPKLKNIRLQNDTLIINLGANFKKLDFIGDEGKRIAQVEAQEQGIFPLSTYEGSYVRAKIHLDDGTVLYSNPIVRYQDELPSNLVDVPINYLKTWMFRLMGFALYVAIFAFFFRLVRHRKR